MITGIGLLGVYTFSAPEKRPFSDALIDGQIHSFVASHMERNLAEAVLYQGAARFWGELGFSVVCLGLAAMMLARNSSRRILIRILQFLAGTI